MVINESYKEGLVGIWWYYNNEFWAFTKTLDDAVDDHGYLQYSVTENHLRLWRAALDRFVKDTNLRTDLLNKGFKSVERGRVIYNIRTQSYEVICSNELVNDITFRNNCINYFNLKGNRVDFFALPHYYKLNLTGNPALDSSYYDE